MDNDKKVIRQISGIRHRTLYRVAAIGIASLITQASPGGAASSWGVECLTTNLESNSYCVTSLTDLVLSSPDEWTLRRSVESANEKAASAATIGFKNALFGTGATPDTAAKIVLASTLEIKANITITAPTTSDGSILLTIERGAPIASGDPLIAVNSITDSVNQATTDVKIENVTIDSRSNPLTTVVTEAAPIATSGVAIQVQITQDTLAGASVLVTPTITLSNSEIKNTVSETGGAAVNTPGNVVVTDNSVLRDNSATRSGDPAIAGDGGAIKAGGNVTIEATSELINNSAAGSGGAISAGGNVTIADPSELKGNVSSEGNGGAISAVGNVSVSGYAIISGNTATVGNGGAISAGGEVTLTNATVSGNKATAGDGGAVSASGIGDVTVIASIVSGNEASAGNGGAISADNKVEISGSALESNIAGQSGGAISAGGLVSVIESSISESKAGTDGGAISAGDTVSVTQGSVINKSTATTGNGGAISGAFDVVVIESDITNSTAGASGGAISAAFEVLVTTGSALSGNTAGQDGGAIKALGAVTIAGSTVELNTAGNDGGGISAGVGVSLSAALISSNTAGNNGGAISAGGAVSLSLDSSVIRNKATAGDGGGISASGTVTVTGSSISLNEATLGKGGGISAGEEVQVSDSTIDGNSAGNKGGGISAETTVAISTNSNITGNTAFAGNGGGISAVGDVTVSTGSTVSFNRAWDASGDGGGIYSSAHVAVTGESTINANYAEGSGGGVNAKTAFIQDSELSGNGSIGGGGAVKVHTSIIVEGGTFSTVKIMNEKFDSDELTENPFYDPRTELPNPFYNHLSLIDGIEVLQYPEAPQNENMTIPNPAYDSIEFVSNPNYDLRETLTIGNFAESFGGAIDIDDDSIEESIIRASITRDSTFVLNSSESESGAIDGHDGKLTITDSLFERNHSSGDGGAIWHSGDLEIVDSQFIGNVNGGVFENVQVLRILFPIERVETGVDFDVEYRSNLLALIDEISFFSSDNGGAIYLGDETTEVSITNSEFTQNTSTADGGAIYFLGLLQIIGTRFEDNWAFYDGGAIYSEGIEIASSDFEGNISRWDGGAIHGKNEGTVLESDFVNNISGEDGGAIFFRGTLSVDDSSFDYNGSTDQGGAIEVTTFWTGLDDGEGNDLFVVGTLDVTNSNFKQNISGDDGGAIHVIGTLDVANSNFQENYAGGDGGAIDIDVEDVLDPELMGSVIENSTFTSNSTDGDGGAVDGSDEELLIIGSTFLGNHAGDDGGAVWNYGNVAITKMSTFTSNTAEDAGGAIYGAGLIAVVDSIFELNVSGSQGGAISAGAVEIARSTFFQNHAYDGGAISINLLDADESITSIIIASEFVENSAGGSGGAIDGSAWILLSTFDSNTLSVGSEGNGAAISLNGSFGTFLVGNRLISAEGDETDLCTIGFWTSARNLGTDASCIGGHNPNAEHPHFSVVSLEESVLGGIEFIEGDSLFGAGEFSLLAYWISEGGMSTLKGIAKAELEASEAYENYQDMLEALEVLDLEIESLEPAYDLWLENEMSLLEPQYALINSQFGLLGSINLENQAEYDSLVLTWWAIDDDVEARAVTEWALYLTNTELKEAQKILVVDQYYLAQVESNSDLDTDDQLADAFLTTNIEFISDNYSLDVKNVSRLSNVLWTAGAMEIIPTRVVEPEPQPEIISGSGEDLVSPILMLIRERTTEQIAFDLLRQQEAKKVSVERLAKTNTDKLARAKARALAAEKRRAQLAALHAKIAATKARGEALKQKSSWINLMKNFPNSGSAKKLVKVPSK